mgnify:CR=1 FL=1
MNDGERYQAGKFYFAYNKSELVLQDIDLEIKKGFVYGGGRPQRRGQNYFVQGDDRHRAFYMGGRYSGDVQVLGESTKGRRVSDIAMRVGLIWRITKASWFR